VRRLFRTPLATAALAMLIVGAGLFGLRAASVLEPLELTTYDWYWRLRPGVSMPDPRILLIIVTEDDLQREGNWPLPDAVLAKAITTLGRLGPRAIGLDLYRDVPVPPGTAALAAALRGDPRVVVVTRFRDAASKGVPAPPALKGTDQVGFNDILVDPGGVVRRGLLFLDDGEQALESFALRLATRYLAHEGITPQADPRDPALMRLGRTTIYPFEPNDGGYVNADARGYQFLLDYSDWRRPFARISLHAVLAGEVPPEIVKDRIVLLGIDAESVKDDFYTPYSRRLGARQHVPGVAIHASIAAGLVRMAINGTPPMRTPRKWQETLLIVAWVIGGGLVPVWIRSPWRQAAVVAGGAAFLGALDFLAFTWNVWLPLVPPVIGWMSSSGLVTAYMSYEETRRRAQLMQLFSRHVSKEVAESIWQHREQFVDGGRPRPQSLIVTALFTDLTGYTSTAERVGPELLMDWLSEYMDAMAREIARHRGVIRQYAGDAIVALFGVPVPRTSKAEVDDDAVRAVECALSMQQALLRLNRRWHGEVRPVTGMRIGIFTGPAVAGTVGTERSEYVVVGDTVNTASRLESFDKELFQPDPMSRPARIFIGHTTLARLGTRFETEWVGDVHLKGKEQTVAIHRVLGRRAVTDAAPERTMR